MRNLCRNTAITSGSIYSLLSKDHVFHVGAASSHSCHLVSSYRHFLTVFIQHHCEMFVCRVVYSCVVNFQLPVKLLLHCIFQKDMDFWGTFCWKGFVLAVKTVCVCICGKSCVWTLAAMPVLFLFTAKCKPETHTPIRISPCLLKYSLRQSSR